MSMSNLWARVKKDRKKRRDDRENICVRRRIDDEVPMGENQLLYKKKTCIRGMCSAS